MNAVKTNMANELRFAVLSQRDAEQVSGGVGEVYSVSPTVIVETLTEAVKPFVNSEIKTFDDFVFTIIRNFSSVRRSIETINPKVYEVFTSWKLDERTNMWLLVWNMMER